MKKNKLLFLILLLVGGMEGAANAEQFTIDFSQFAPGIYDTFPGSLPAGMTAAGTRIFDCHGFHPAFGDMCSGSGPYPFEGSLAWSFDFAIDKSKIRVQHFTLRRFMVGAVFSSDVLVRFDNFNFQRFEFFVGAQPTGRLGFTEKSFTSNSPIASGYFSFMGHVLNNLAGVPGGGIASITFDYTPAPPIPPQGQTVPPSQQNSELQPTNSKCLNVSPDGQPSLCPVGKPVNVATGALWHETEDFSIPGRTPDTALTFRRMYLANPYIPTGDLGPHWHHNFETRLYALPDDSIVWVDENGGPWTFLYQKNENTYLTPIGLNAALTVSPEIITLKKKDGTLLTFSTSTGLLQQITERHGESITLTYDTNGKLAQVSSPLAGSLNFERNSSGRIQAITRSRDNLSFHYSYDDAGNLIQVKDFANHSYAYTYWSGQTSPKVNGLLATITDPLQRELRFTYYADGRAYQQFEPGGATRTFEYGDHNAKVTDIDGLEYRYFFDADLHTKKIVYPDGSKLNSLWENGYLVRTFWEHGGSTYFGYDAHGNNNSVRRPGDATATLATFDQTFDKPILITPVVGAPIQFELDSNSGDVMGMSRGGLSLAFTRDAFGNLLATANGRTTYANMRNGDGLLTTVFDSHNPETRSYDARSRLHTRTFASGRQITYGYDDYDRVISITDSNGPSIFNSYDAMGKLLFRTVSDGSTDQTTSYVYDDHDRLLTITDPMNRVTTFGYDPVKIFDKPISITDAANRVTHFEYDLRHRLVKKTDAVGAITKYTYDQRSNLTSVTDANGGKTIYSYDLNDRKVYETRESVAGTTPVKRVTQYFYDQGDRLVREVTKSATGGADRIVSYEYDQLDRLVGKKIGIEGTSLLDKALKLVTGSGRLLSTDDTATFTYEDQLDATLLKTAVNDIASLGFTNEAAPPFAGTGFSVAASQGGNPLALIEGNFDIGRDVTGEISSVGKDGNNLFTKSYDSAGRLTGVTAGSFSSTIGYDGFGLKNSVVHSSGESGSFQRDLLSRLTQVTWTGPTPISETLTYDPLTGNPTSITRENGVYTVAYDAIDQLTSSTGAYNHSITYDALGNREQSSVNGAGSFVNNFLVANGQSSFLADPDGFGDTIKETTGTVVKNYLYRADGRMNGYQSGSTQAAYYFDALGRRVAKVIDSGSGTFNQSFMHLGSQDRILQAKAGDGTVTTYIDGQGIDDHLAEIKGGVGKGYITDHLGSVLNSEPAGANHSFGLFGETSTPMTVSPSSSAVMYGWQSLSYDAESGSYDNHARRYNQNTGTFASQDPFGFASGEINYLGSRKNNPLKYVDSSGKNPVFVVIALGAVAGGVGNLIGAYASDSLTRENAFSTFAIGAVGGATAVAVSGAATAAIGLGAAATIGEILALQVSGTGAIASAGAVLLDVATTVIYNSESAVSALARSNEANKTAEECAPKK